MKNLKKEKNHGSTDSEDTLHSARTYALKLLSYSAKTLKEIHERLSVRGFTSDTISKVLSEFIKAGYLDDRKVADNMAHSALIKKGRGRVAIKYALYKRGIEKQIIKDIIEAISVPQEAQAARNYLARKLIPIDTQQEKNRAYLILNQRGFSEEAIEQALSKPFTGASS
jgi:regulatory protein